MLLSACTPRTPGPEIKDGLLDLRARSITDEGPYELSGGWHFYWKKFVLPGESAAGAETIPVPGTWTSGEESRTQGFATYRLRILLPPDTEPLFLKQMPVDTAYTLYVNGRRAASNGTAGNSKETARPQWLPLIIPLGEHNGTYDLLLHVSNFDLNQGGPFYASYLGTYSQIQSMRDRGLLRDALLIGTLLLFGVYHLLVFAFRTSHRSALFFGIACLFAALRAAAGGEKLFFQTFAGVPWEVLQKFSMLGGYGILPFWMGFLLSVFPREFSRKIVYPVYMICALTALTVIAFPARIHFETGIPYYILNLLCFLYACVMLVIALLRKREGAGMVLAGLVLILSALVHDFLFELGILHGTPLLSAGIFLFFFVQSVALARLLSRAFQRVELLSFELERKNEHLTELDALKDEFLANTSHELRTPLNGIIGIAESLIQGAAGRLGQSAEENLTLIAASGRRLASLVSDLLDFSKIKHGDAALMLKPVDLKSVVEVVLQITRPLAAPGVTLAAENLEIPPVLADEERLEQILQNLVGNAVKFTDHGRITVSAKAENGRALITVSDTGIGIPPDRQQAIFESFTQADGSISRRYGGTGLGLSITRKLVEMHGGTIGVRSVESKGADFYFSLPLAGSEGAPPALLPVETPEQPPAASEKPQAPEETAPAAEEKNPLPGRSVLIVDDDRVNLQVLRNHLELNGCLVREALNGQTALALLDEAAFDVVLLDVMMPGASGYEVCREIRKRYSTSELPILMLTAKTRIIDLVAGLESGANDYLTKPFEARELIARVRTMVELKTAASSQSQLVSIHNELRLATEIQKSLLPPRPPVFAELEIGVEYRSMKSVGGDFYDFADSGEHLGVLIADVSGHGVPAAMLTSVVKTAFGMQTNYAEPALVLSSMNRILRGNTGNEFVTATYLSIHRGTKTLTVGNAGHPALLLYRAAGHTLEILRPRGRLLGVFDAPQFNTATTELHSGDRIVIYTDGLYEAHNKNDEAFGEARLRDYVLKNRAMSPSEFAAAMAGVVTDWSGGADSAQDDMAVVVLDIV